MNCISDELWQPVDDANWIPINKTLIQRGIWQCDLKSYGMSAAKMSTDLLEYKNHGELSKRYPQCGWITLCLTKWDQNEMWNPKMTS